MIHLPLPIATSANRPRVSSARPHSSGGVIFGQALSNDRDCRGRDAKSRFDIPAGLVDVSVLLGESGDVLAVRFYNGFITPQWCVFYRTPA